MKILLSLSFVGTDYCGYQIQPNGATVQQKLNEATEALFGYPCDIVGCSRTDSGVHANMFCVTVTKKGTDSLDTGIPIESIPRALATHLPEDISVLSAEAVAEDFHPRYDVHHKEYIYRIWNRSERNPFLRDRAWHCPRPIDDASLRRMQMAANTWIGTHDFTSYMATGSKITDAVRTIYEAEVTRAEDGTILFRVSANGFLYHMVRILTGTLMDVAYGKLAPSDVEVITAARDRTAAGQTAPAHGLYLNRVVYHKDL